MKKLIALILVIGLASVFSQVTNGAVISENTIDKMHDTSYWFSNSTTNYYIGKNWLQYIDPNDRIAGDTTSFNDGLELVRTDGNNFSWSYQAGTGKTFDVVQASVLGRGWGETASLTYKIAGGAEVALAPTAATVLANASWGGGSWLYTYDFTSLDLKPNEITFTLSYVENYMPMVSSVKMDVIPEPTSLALLVVGGLCCLRRSRRHAFLGCKEYKIST